MDDAKFCEDANTKLGVCTPPSDSGELFQAACIMKRLHDRHDYFLHACRDRIQSMCKCCAHVQEVNLSASVSWLTASMVIVSARNVGLLLLVLFSENGTTAFTE
jgi:hypothetical protein